MCRSVADISGSSSNAYTNGFLNENDIPFYLFPLCFVLTARISYSFKEKASRLSYPPPSPPRASVATPIRAEGGEGNLGAQIHDVWFSISRTLSMIAAYFSVFWTYCHIDSNDHSVKDVVYLSN